MIVLVSSFTFSQQNAQYATGLFTFSYVRVCVCTAVKCNVIVSCKPRREADACQLCVAPGPLRRLLQLRDPSEEPGHRSHRPVYPPAEDQCGRWQARYHLQVLTFIMQLIKRPD